MSTTKKQSAKATPPVVEASTHGLNHFDGRSIVKAITEAFKQAEVAKGASEAKAAAAYSVCCEAERVRGKNATLDREAWSNSWRSSVRGILPQLHAAGIGWVEQTESKLKNGDVRVGYRLTSYGQNISSDANQVGQYDIDCQAAESLQGVRKAIRAAKEAEAEAELTDDQRECMELAGKLTEAFGIVSELLADAESIEAYQLALGTMSELIEANTPISVDTDSDNDAEIAELMQATA